MKIAELMPNTFAQEEERLMQQFINADEETKQRMIDLGFIVRNSSEKETGK